MSINTTIAVITASVAVLVAIITWRDWATNRARLRHELFERRYAVYEQIATFLATVLQQGGIPEGEPESFLRKTKTAYFVFAGDSDVKDLISEIYKKAIDLHAWEATEEGLVGEELKKNIQDQRVIKDWFAKTLDSMESLFAKYLSLKH